MREPQNQAKPTSVEIVAEFSSAFHFANPICQSVLETTTSKYSKTDRCQLAYEPTDIFPVLYDHPVITTTFLWTEQKPTHFLI